MKLLKEVQELYKQGYKNIITQDEFIELIKNTTDESYNYLIKDLENTTDAFFYYDDIDLFNIDKDILELIKNR